MAYRHAQAVISVKWNIVRGFGRVKYFNISYVVLLVVPILMELHTKAAAASELFNKTVAFPATLHWLYAASLFYAVAIVLYQYFCPTDIKRFANADEYVANSHEIFLRAHPHHRLNIVLAHLNSDVDAEIKSKIDALLHRRDNSVGNERLEVQRELDILVESLHADAVQRYLLKDYEAKNVQFTVALWASFILYVFGTLILVVLLTIRSLHVFGFI